MSDQLGNNCVLCLNGVSCRSDLPLCEACEVTISALQPKTRMELLLKLRAMLAARDQASAFVRLVELAQRGDPDMDDPADWWRQGRGD